VIDMQIVHQVCCGLDIHKKLIVACLLKAGGEAEGHSHKEVRSFGTMTGDLLALGDWLQSEGCTQLAMESTGVYWKPIFNVLEGQLEIVLANPRHLKAVPGRKTDIKDAEWIADLLQHGLMACSNRVLSHLHLNVSYAN
jgi:transposase